MITVANEKTRQLTKTRIDAWRTTDDGGYIPDGGYSPYGGYNRWPVLRVRASAKTRIDACTKRVMAVTANMAVTTGAPG